MNLSGKGAFGSDSKLTALKSTSLNPHAAEFVPFSLQSASRIFSSADASSQGDTSASVTLGKAVPDLLEFSASNNSDDEALQYWRQQLPDDITPDFNVVREDESQELNNLSLSDLSISNENETSRLPASAGSNLIFNIRQQLSPHPIGGNRFIERETSTLSYGEDPSVDYYQNNLTNSWDEQIMNNNQLVANVRGGPQLNGNVEHGFLPNMLNEQMQMDYTDVNPLEFLSSQFPGFSAESLGEVYFANEGDLNLTIEMLTQLELQIDGGLNQNGSSKAVSSPNLTLLDFPALSAAAGQNGMQKFSDDEVQQQANSYRPSDKDNMLLFRSSSSIPSRGQIDFASAVRKIASQGSDMWKYERNGSSDSSVGSSRSSNVLASSYSNSRVFGDRLQPRASSRAAPVWLETGEAVANMYSEVREEARDHARIRNAYFEQARQAYLIGNKALAKELSVKGQLHNTQMKAAHGKAQESIYRQRNPGGPGMQIKGSGQERIIDLHGLHANEAIHVLKRELVILRKAARSADLRLQVYICVGTGHHTRGSRTPARLPIAVQSYLLEEGLDYSEPQPGLLRIVIY